MTVLRIVTPDGSEHAVGAGEAAPVGAAAAAAVRGARPARSLVIAGTEVAHRSLARRVRAGLAVVADAPVAPAVDVTDHLAAIAPRSVARALLRDAPLLAGRGGDPAGVLSGGERQVLAWLRAVALRPRVVLLDGAGRGADDDTLDWMADQVARWTAAGVAVAVHAVRPEERAWA